MEGEVRLVLIHESVCSWPDGDQAGWVPERPRISRCRVSNTSSDLRVHPLVALFAFLPAMPLIPSMRLLSPLFSRRNGPLGVKPNHRTPVSEQVSCGIVVSETKNDIAMCRQGWCVEQLRGPAGVVLC